MNNNLITWIENWYKNNCDGDWEHSYGITIETLDNPGWDVKIDLIKTPLENKKIKYTYNKKSESDWYGYELNNGVFKAFGDPHKLLFLLELFKNMMEGKIK